MRALSAVVLLLIVSSSSAWAVCDPNKPNLTPTTRYVINGAEVFDKQTNLTWQRCSVGQEWKKGVGCVGPIKYMTWDEAMQQASGGWRVPAINELATLISPTCDNPAINEEAFPNMDLDKLVYWSSTGNSAPFAWLVFFLDGSKYFHNRTLSFAVRLVRGDPRL